MAIMHRPFASAQQMIDTLIEKHNSVVFPSDSIIMAGDICYQKAPETLHYVKAFNGRKMLFRGNHDRVFTNSELSQYFEVVVDEGEGLKRDDFDFPVYITHYPHRGRPDCFNLVGHIHSAWKYQKNMMNVGVDVHHFMPVRLDTIPFHFEAICKHYDEDVWAAYNPINAQHLFSRGKSGTYPIPLTEPNLSPPVG